MALRMQLAQGLMQGGQAPAQGFGENAANLGSKLIGAYMAKKVMDEGKNREKAKNDTLANALRAGQGQAAETKTYGDGTTINWDERKADPSQMAAILAGNRDTAGMGLQLQLGQIEDERKSKAALAAELRKSQLDRENEFWKPIKTEDGSIIIPALVPGFQMPGQAPQTPTPAPQAPGGGVDMRTASAAPNPPKVHALQEVPAMFRDTINTHAERTGLPPELLGQVFMTESGARPDVVSGQTVSSAGAQGPMQVMPGTQRAPGFGVVPAKDGSPEENFRVGSDYLAAMNKKYGGNVQHALMAYNWGPGNVDAWLKSGADPAKVPAETRNYVARITGGDTQQPPAAPAQGGRVQVADASGTIPASVPAPGAPPNQPGVLYRGQGKAVRNLTADEVRQAGLPTGTVAQIDRDGKISVLNKGEGDGGGGPFGGNGLPAQDSNLWIQFQTKLAKGETLTPQEQLAMALIEQRATQPRTIMTDQGLASVPGMPLPTLPGRQQAPPAAPPAAAQPAATDTVPNPLAPPAPAQPPAAPPAPPAAAAPPGLPKVTIIQEKAPAKPTNEQNLNAGFANRLNMANSVFDSLEGDGYVTPSLKDRAASNIPVVGGYLESENFQKQDQARREFINAQLRRESGASISDAEFANANRQYFPQPGDSDAVIAQKRVSRELAIANMAQSAGPAEINFKLKPTPKEGDKPATPATVMKFDAEGNIIQ
jgi:soluble lytic murein transglycosylase-like protein